MHGRRSAAPAPPPPSRPFPATPALPLPLPPSSASFYLPRRHKGTAAPLYCPPLRRRSRDSPPGLSSLAGWGRPRSGGRWRRRRARGWVRLRPALPPAAPLPAPSQSGPQQDSLPPPLPLRCSNRHGLRLRGENQPQPVRARTNRPALPARLPTGAAMADGARLRLLRHAPAEEPGDGEGASG